MKNLILILAASLTLTLLSCGKDDSPMGGDNPEVPEVPEPELTGLEGPWNLNSLEYAGSETTSSASTPDVITYFNGIGEENNLVFSFNDDDTYSTTGSCVITVTSTVGGFTQTFEESFTDLLSSGSFEFEDPALTFTEGDRVVETNIEEMTDTSLTLQFFVSTSSTLFGVTMVKNLNYSVNFVK